MGGQRPEMSRSQEGADKERGDQMRDEEYSDVVGCFLVSTTDR